MLFRPYSLRGMRAVRALTFVASSLLILGEVVEAAEIRLSVKFILDANGNRAMGSASRMNTNSELEAQVLWGNYVLCHSGSDFRIRIDEIVDLPGYGPFFNFACGGASKSIMESVFKLNPIQSRWRTNRVNVYIVGSDCAASCSFPTYGDIIVMGQSPNRMTLLHELGHYFGLYHTQGASCGDCGTCGSQSDSISDTILDDACWETANRMALENYGLGYLSLPAAKRKLVDQTFANIMSYHVTTGRWVLTPKQNDTMMLFALLDRAEVINWDHEPDRDCPVLKFPAPPRDEEEDAEEGFGKSEGDEEGFSRSTPDDEAASREGSSSEGYDRDTLDPPIFVRGDVNSDGRIGLDDATALIDRLFEGTDGVKCDDAADVNDDGVLNSEDAALLLAIALDASAALRDALVGEPTVDRTADELGCADPPRG